MVETIESLGGKAFPYYHSNHESSVQATFAIVQLDVEN